MVVLEKKGGWLKSAHRLSYCACRNITIYGNPICKHFAKLNVTGLIAFETASDSFCSMVFLQT